MQTKIEIPENLSNKLVELPEQGMGYQIVDITLVDGTILKNRQIFNCTYLLLEEDESISVESIVEIDLSTNV